jgi:hypothetical protein
MKTTILLTILLFAAAVANAEPTETYQVYEPDERTGFKGLFPKKEIEVDDQEVRIYRYNDYGLKSVFPERIIESDRPVKHTLPNSADVSISLQPTSRLPSLLRDR